MATHIHPAITVSVKSLQISEHEIWRAHYDLAVEAYAAGRLTADQFCARLARLGFAPGEADREAEYHAQIAS